MSFKIDVVVCILLDPENKILTVKWMKWRGFYSVLVLLVSTELISCFSILLIKFPDMLLSMEQKMMSSNLWINYEVYGTCKYF
jgi:hypothetical protein